MARYEKTYAGERRTAFIGLHLTPSERAELDSAAALQGASVSDYSRELLFRRPAAVVAGTRRNPEAAGLARQLSALGNLLNQIARHGGALSRWDLWPMRPASCAMPRRSRRCLI